MRRGLKPRLLPTLIGLSVVAVGFRGADVVSRLVVGTAIEPVGTAKAQAPKPAAQATAAPDAPAQAAGAQTVATSDIAPAGPDKVDANGHALPEKSFSPGEIELLQNLSKRRDELDQREAGIEQRAAVLKVAEDRVNQKLAELNSVKSDLEKLLDVQKQKQSEEIESLVKIYSNMGEKDAARIFNTLEMPVLLSVVSKMKEQKTAKIIAGMQPDRARELTDKLADLRELPQGAAPSVGPAGPPIPLSPAASAAAAAIPPAPQPGQSPAPPKG